MVEVPVFVSLVAVIVEEPAATAVTRPFASTVAAVGLPDAHVISRPVSTLAFASLVTAVSCCVGVIPSTRPAVGGVTVTLATGTGLTVITGVVALGADSLVAVIVPVPVPTAVTVAGEPLALTVSTAVLLEIHVILRPVTTLLFASLVVAVSCWVPPRTIGVVGAESVTVATGAGVTVRTAPPDFPSLVATMFAVPTVTAETSPLDGPTVATPVLSELHAIARPVRTRAWASRNVAVACVV